MPPPDRHPPPGAVPAALPANEAARLEALHATNVLDTAPELLFDDIAKLAALICGTPIALISLVDEQRQWFKARVGLEATETPRDQAFCAHAILQPQALFEVPDAAADPRFQGNPLVTGDPRIRFYAGAPLLLPGGEALGTLCAIDRQPRQLDEAQRQALLALSRQASRLLQWRRAAALEAAQLRQEVDRSRQKLWQATALATQGLGLLAYVDHERVFRYVNDVFLEYWGRAREQVEGAGVALLFGAEAYEAAVRPHLERAFAGESLSIVARMAFAARGPRTVHASYLPVRDGTDAVQAVVMRLDDIEEIEQARRQLAGTNELLERRNLALQGFIQMMSHDIREPVNTICNFAGLLEQQTAAVLDEPARRSLGFIRRGGDRMRALLDDLLAYLALENDQPGALARQAVPLGPLFDADCEDLADAIERHGARLGGEPLPTVHGNASMLRLLFQNLLANALKFHAPGCAPAVSWGARPAEGGVEIWVRDAGIGIAPDKVERLFAPFSRLVRRSQFEGTGLGLAICRRIAELHGGRIRVDSAPGAGSTFSVFLPHAGTAPHSESENA